MWFFYAILFVFLYFYSYIYSVMINTAPKFKKIVLILKSPDTLGLDKDITPTIKIEHEDCGMVITGDYVIITEDQNSDVFNESPSVKGKIYELKEIDSYKLYNL